MSSLTTAHRLAAGAIGAVLATTGCSSSTADLTSTQSRWETGMALLTREAPDVLKLLSTKTLHDLSQSTCRALRVLGYEKALSMLAHAMPMPKESRTFIVFSVVTTCPYLESAVPGGVG